MRRFPGVASAVFACAIGCGKTSTLSDASHIDGSSIDAITSVDAVPVGDVTVTTHSRCCTEPNGTLEANIPVFSVQPDGAAGPTGTTDATGKVTLSGVQAGASITAVYPATNGYQLVTVLAVKPGDNLVFGDEYRPTAVAGGTMTVTFDAYNGATSYSIYGPCGVDFSGGEGATSVTVNESCGGATANLLAVALDSNGDAIAAGVLKNVTFTDGQTVALAAWTPSTAGNFTESISGLAPEVTSVNLGATPVVDGASLYQGTTSATPAAGAASAALSVPGVGDRTYAFAQLYRNGQVGRQETYLSGAGDATSATFTAPPLPWLGQLTINGTAQVATWIQIGTGSYDAAIIATNWSHFDSGTQTTTYYNWNIAVPPGVTQLDWANAPVALAGYYPNTADFVNGDMQLVDLSTAAGYDELRAAPEWQWMCPHCVTSSGEISGVSSVALTDGGEGFPSIGRRAAPHAAPPRQPAHR